MRTTSMNTPQPVSLHAFESSTSAFEQARTREIGPANRLNSDCVYQAATIAAALLVLMSI